MIILFTKFCAITRIIIIVNYMFAFILQILRYSAKLAGNLIANITLFLVIAI